MSSKTPNLIILIFCCFYNGFYHNRITHRIIYFHHNIWVHIRRRSAYFFVEAYCFSKVKISPSRSIAMVLPS